jgi:hypothetical protein
LKEINAISFFVQFKKWGVSFLVQFKKWSDSRAAAGSALGGSASTFFLQSVNLNCLFLIPSYKFLIFQKSEEKECVLRKVKAN